MSLIYNRIGRMLSATSSASTSTYEYTGFALTKEIQDNYIIERFYDSMGRAIGYEFYSPDDLINPVQTIIYGYSDSGQFHSIVFVNSDVTNRCVYTYLSGTDLISGYTVSTSSIPSTILTVSKTYEPYRNLITAISNSWNSAVISSFDYSNDPLGRRTKRGDYFNASTIINDFTYNIFGEIIEAAMGNNIYINDYDPIGNRSQCTIDNGQLITTNVYSANQLNQYTDIINSQFSTINSHDDDGNMTWNGRKSLAYDAENRLSSEAPNYWGTTNGATRTDYTYDYMNRRVSKTTSIMSGRQISYPPSPLDPQGAWSALETRNFIYDGWNLVAEIIIDQTEFTTNVSYYTWGLDLSGTLQGAGGVGGLLCESKITSFSTNSYYTFSDANGNITEYVDDTGTVKAHFKYNAFGETTYKSGTMKDDFAFRFSSKYFDPETGFYNYGHRYYDPILGRWISADPIEESDGPGRYLFLKNDGVNKWDYLGLRASLVISYNQFEFGNNASFDISGIFKLINNGSLTGQGSIIQNMSMKIEIFDCDTGDVRWNIKEQYSEVLHVGGWDDWFFIGGEVCTRGKAVWKGVAQYYDSYVASHNNDPWNFPWSYGDSTTIDPDPWGGLLGMNAWARRLSYMPDAQGYSRSVMVEWNFCGKHDSYKVSYSGGSTDEFTP